MVLEVREDTPGKKSLLPRLELLEVCGEQYQVVAIVSQAYLVLLGSGAEGSVDSVKFYVALEGVPVADVRVKKELADLEVSSEAALTKGASNLVEFRHEDSERSVEVGNVGFIPKLL